MTGVCLGLLCGLPASGKSRLAVQIEDHVVQELPWLRVLVLHYDNLIPAPQQLVENTDEHAGSLWKAERNQITVCVDYLLNILKHEPEALGVTCLHENIHDPYGLICLMADGHIVQPSAVDSALWERFLCEVRNSVKKTRHCRSGFAGSDMSWLVLVDDNMQYSSMRYQYCQLARKYETGFCTLHVSCPLEEALQRNQLRVDDRVQDTVITLMHQRLETPDPHKRPWEKYSATVSGTSAVSLQPLLEMIQMALRNPHQCTLEKDTEEKAVSRYVCSISTVHQADLILRRCVSLHMTQAKGSGLNSGELRTLSAELTKIRTAILTEMKQGELTLPFLLDDIEVSDASKNTNSPLFLFVQTLFSSRTNHIS